MQNWFGLVLLARKSFWPATPNTTKPLAKKNHDDNKSPRTPPRYSLPSATNLGWSVSKFWNKKTRD